YIRLSGIMGFRAVMPAPTNIPNISAFLIREFLSFFFYHKHLDKLKFEPSSPIHSPRRLIHSEPLASAGGF
ncbi:MAG: hypothetical protein IK108_04595, partial [Clostridia bacterium]|nr:hypothetical protein [Clostridia bacterium]